MHLGLRQGDGDAQHPAALIGADTYGREHGGVTHDPAITHLFIPGVEDQILDLAKRPVPPGGQFVVEQLGGAAGLAGRQAFDAEFTHHRFGVSGRDALHIHLGHSQHHGAHRATSALQGLRVEGRAVVPCRLGHIDRHCRVALKSALPQSVWRNGSILARNNSGPARPYMARLRVFRRLI